MTPSPPNERRRFRKFSSVLSLPPTVGLPLTVWQTPLVGLVRLSALARHRASACLDPSA